MNNFQLSSSPNSRQLIGLGGVSLFSFLAGLHLGVNEFISFQFISFLVMYALAFRYWVSNIEYWTVFLLFVGVGFAGVFLSGQDSHYYLVSLRVAASVGLLYIYCRFVPLSAKGLFSTKNIIFALEWAVVFNLILASAQLVDSLFFRAGFFDLPDSWFAIEYGTLVADLRLKLQDTDYFVRPSGFYSEPSALSALGVIGFYVANFFKSVRLAFLSFILISLSFSLSGLIFLGFLLMFFVLFRVGLFGAGKGRGYAVIFLTLISFFMVLMLGSRLLSVLGGEDNSATVRVGEPLRIIGDMFSQGELLGLSHGELLSRAADEVSTIFDNWLFNQIMMYGVVGVVLIGMLYFAFPVYIWPVFVAYGFMNGDMLYYDRILYIVLACISVRAASQGSSNASHG